MRRACQSRKVGILYPGIRYFSPRICGTGQPVSWGERAPCPLVGRGSRLPGSAHCDEQGTDRGDGGTEPRDAAIRGGGSSVPFDGGMNVSAPAPAKIVVDAST